ncbi:putative short chain-type dehydrogenase [Aspergillus oryzae 100-8]|uniref:Hydroxyacyl dehydrogenase n=2 Tax=Aspergillus subgen. Circumdati TaxID=2720871 RepID=A0AB74BYW2_ASPFL|nr:putative short chain-type dehydrogenase [Aspergillus oryzae 3.042]KDE77279.1 putative short chain-type dehydrogenase [Aspergillus oryzae 100-8]RAQ78480.1 hypothetical protein COH21_011995 [Aspergillus flavus]RMZ39523.1 hypothetical protein CA14_010147 [Aspergillus flavus]|eukprot:EIT76283.1 putative short chain-type dehydrogenase [Aspergillus oryzae 3.042]
MSNVLITGSSRGLGLELVRQLASGECQGGIVIAAARKCSPELRDLISHSHGSVVFVPLDLTDERAITKSVTAVQSALKEKSLDVLINCAGVHSETQGKLVHMCDLDYHLSVNVVGTHNVIRQYLPFMRDSKVKKIANISSAYGSLANASDVAYAPCPAYKISKAALNALTVQYALSYKDDGFIFLSVNPGWLQSDMGGMNADLTLPQGADAVLNVILAADCTDNGRFKNIHVPGWEAYNGEDVPW